MGLGFTQNFLLILTVALVGGIIFRLLKLPLLVGYILAGVLAGLIFSVERNQVEGLANLGVILLSFSVGIELSLSKLGRVGKLALLGGTMQMLLVILLSFLMLTFLGFDRVVSIILALGFSLSSTVIVVKLLEDKGETATFYGEVMLAWSLIQDLAVVPMIILLPRLSNVGTVELSTILLSLKSIVYAAVVVAVTVILGKMVVPFLIHKVASFASREVLVLCATVLALSMAWFSSLFGISPVIGAFLAGLVISETQENNAIFAEIRPLRNIFSSMFFVSLGFFVLKATLISNLPLILFLSAFVILVKIVASLIATLVLNIKGRTSLALSLGLDQIGEFSFVLYLTAGGLKIFNENMISIGISTTLITLIISPLLFEALNPLWRKLKNFNFFSTYGNKKLGEADDYKNHVILCGFGRVGKWIGRGLEESGITYLVVDYNQNALTEVAARGVPFVFGDPSEPKVLESAGIRNAKAVVIAIPDKVAQTEIISYTQTVNRDAKIITRVHQDEDWRRFIDLKVTKVIQPEFEASLAVVRYILGYMGRSKEQILDLLKALRLSRAKSSG